MIIADYLNYGQHSMLKDRSCTIICRKFWFDSGRLYHFMALFFMGKPNYVVALWVGAMYLLIAKEFWCAAIPAVFMTWNILLILSQKIGLGLDLNLSYGLAFIFTILWIGYFTYQYKKLAGASFELDHLYHINNSKL